jgi:hypothetical protein
MARFYGEIGFGDTVETAPGVWADVITERKFYGDVPRNIYQSNTTDKVNDDVDTNTSLRVMGTAYAFAHIKDMQYVKFNGEYWSINTVEIQRPRLILNLGGVYNGPKGGASGAA